MPITPKISAVLLAAGFSSRMQSFKPLLPLGGTTVIEHVIDTLKQAGISDIVAVLGYRASEMIPLLEKRMVHNVVNEHYKEGMYGSVQAGIGALRVDTEAFLIFPVDVPLVKPHSIRLLVRNFSKYHSDVTYPVFQGERGHPPLISARIIPLILSQNRADGLRGLLEEQASSHDVELVDEGVLVDMDTQEDYRRIKEWTENAGIPTPAECEDIFARTQTPQDTIRHGRVVSEVARTLVLRLKQSGIPLNENCVETAGLLHDLAKGKRNHALKGGRILQSLGFGPVAKIVSRHMDLDFSATDSLDETAIVYLADKLTCHDHCVSLETRFAAAITKYSQGHMLEQFIVRRLSIAQTIAAAVEKTTGQPLSEILPLDIAHIEENGSNAAKA